MTRDIVEFGEFMRQIELEEWLRARRKRRSEILMHQIIMYKWPDTQGLTVTLDDDGIMYTVKHNSQEPTEEQIRAFLDELSNDVANPEIP